MPCELSKAMRIYDTRTRICSLVEGVRDLGTAPDLLDDSVDDLFCRCHLRVCCELVRENE
jgi:hypothetical protein